MKLRQIIFKSLPSSYYYISYNPPHPLMNEEANQKKISFGAKPLVVRKLKERRCTSFFSVFYSFISSLPLRAFQLLEIYFIQACVNTFLLSDNQWTDRSKRFDCPPEQTNKKKSLPSLRAYAVSFEAQQAAQIQDFPPSAQVYSLLAVFGWVSAKYKFQFVWTGTTFLKWCVSGHKKRHFTWLQFS